MPGPHSYPQIQEIAKKSGISHRVTSTLRFTDKLYHAQGNAVDFGGYNQDALAGYFWQWHNKEGMLEILHATKSRVYYMGSKGVSNARDSLMADHTDHLHVAMTRKLADAILNGTVAQIPNKFEAKSTGFDLNPLDDVINLVKSILEVFESMKKFFEMLTDAFTWKRVGFAIVGVLILVLAVWALGLHGNIESIQKVLK